MPEQIDLLLKFDSVQVDAASRISPEDAAFCEAERLAYDRAYSLYTPFRASLSEAMRIESEEMRTRADNTGSSSNTYCENYGDGGLSGIDKRIQEIQGNFVHAIVYYFSRKYDVEFDSNVVYDNLGLKKPENDWRNSRADRDAEEYRVKSSRRLDFNEVVDEVILQLDGLTFADKVVQQIKNDARESANRHRGNDAYYTVDKKTIRFGDRFTALRDNYSKILRALWHYNTGATSVSPHWAKTLQTPYYDEDKRVGSPYEFEGWKACKLRYFKSGRWDITFSSAEYADAFARLYLGY